MKEFFKAILYKPLFNILIFLTWLVPGNNIGWAIVTLTVLIRLALLPSTAKATTAQRDISRLAPLVADIKKKYKDDRQGEAQATMELYKEHGVSPWGSCLPLLIQLPILWVLYRVFMVGLNTERFDLLYKFTPAPDHINTIWLGMDLSQPNRWVLPILAGLAQLLQSWQMKKMNPQPEKGKDSQNPADFSRILSGQMMFIMPIFTVIIAMRLPAALALYWFITTLFMVGQTWWLMRKKQKPLPVVSKTDEKDEPKKELEAPKAEPKKRKGIADRLADRATRYKGRKDVKISIRKKD